MKIGNAVLGWMFFVCFSPQAPGSAGWRLPEWKRRVEVQAEEGATAVRVPFPPGARRSEIRVVDATTGRVLPHWAETLEVSSRRAVAQGRRTHYGFPRMVRARNGDLLLFYRVGLTHVYDPSLIAMRISGDNGKTWSAERTIHRDPKADHSATNTVPLVTPSGRILNWLSSFGFRTPHTREATYWRSSGDHGRTWSEMQLFDRDRGRSTYYVTDAINTTDGLLACAATFPPGGIGNCWAVVWHSPDGGRTWTVRSNLTSPAENRGDEVAMLETAPGSVLCLLRGRQRPDNPHRQGLYQFWSSDGGRTWVEGENLYRALGCTLQRPFLARLDAGMVLLTGRDYDRKLVVAYVSRDNARTFGERHVIDSYVSDGAYTAAVPTSPDTVLMAYYTDVDSAPLMPDIKLISIKVHTEPMWIHVQGKASAPARMYVYFDNPEAPPGEQRAGAGVGGNYAVPGRLGSVEVNPSSQDNAH